MKKRLIAVVVAVCALAVLAIGSTFAFFTSQSHADNTFTMGNLEIDLTETSEASEGVKAGTVADNHKGIEYTNALPGDTFSKVPVVSNESNNTAWIRVSVDVNPVDGKGFVEDYAKELKANIVADMETRGWALGADGYLYYDTILAAKGEAGDSVTLFETVKIPTTWGNDAAEMGFTIDINAYAVQADNNGATWDAAEWIGDFNN